MSDPAPSRNKTRGESALCALNRDESALLHILLRSPEHFDEVIDHLVPVDFESVPHRHVFSAALAIRSESAVPDPCALANKLEADGKLESIGGPIVLSEIWEYSASEANLSHYLARVIEASELRHVSRLQDNGALSTSERASFLAASARRIRCALDQHSPSDPLVEEMKKHALSLDILSVPSTEDAVIGPFWGTYGDQIIVAGPAAAGKTALAINMMLAHADPSRRGRAVGGVFQLNQEHFRDKKIAVIDGETSDQRWSTLLRRVIEHEGIDPELLSDEIKKKIVYISAHDLGIRDPANWASHSIAVARMLSDLGVAFFIVDSIGRFWNAPNLSDMDWVQQGLAVFAEECRALKPAIPGLLIGHTKQWVEGAPEPDGPIGTSLQKNYVDGTILVFRTTNGHRLVHKKNRRAWWIREGVSIEVRWPSQGYGFIPQTDWKLHWPHEIPDVDSGRESAGPTDSAAKVRDALEGMGNEGSPVSSIASAVGLSERQTRRLLKDLQEIGAAKKADDGRWIATPEISNSNP